MELISYNEAISAIYNMNSRTGIDAFGKDQIIDALDKVQKVDPVQATGGCYCKECRFWWKENNLCARDGACSENCAIMECDANDFCSFGERKSKK